MVCVWRITQLFTEFLSGNVQVVQNKCFGRTVYLGFQNSDPLVSVFQNKSVSGGILNQIIKSFQSFNLTHGSLLACYTVGNRTCESAGLQQNRSSNSEADLKSCWSEHNTRIEPPAWAEVTCWWRPEAPGLERLG